MAAVGKTVPAQAAEGPEAERTMGRRKRRRWANERLLREMAGPLSAEDMASQFAPVPFGTPRPTSALESAVRGGGLLLERVLRPDEEEERLLAAARAGPSPRRPAPPAGGGWGAVKRKNREALATAPTALVRQLEEGLFSALASRGREPVLDVEEAYQRLLLYGIAQFHGIAVERREPAGLRFQRRPREGGAQERLHRILAAPG